MGLLPHRSTPSCRWPAERDQLPPVLFPNSWLRALIGQLGSSAGATCSSPQQAGSPRRNTCGGCGAGGEPHKGPLLHCLDCPPPGLEAGRGPAEADPSRGGVPHPREGFVRPFMPEGVGKEPRTYLHDHIGTLCSPASESDLSELQAQPPTWTYTRPWPPDNRTGLCRPQALGHRRAAGTGG